jgi:hypothetical protein
MDGADSFRAYREGSSRIGSSNDGHYNTIPVNKIPNPREQEKFILLTGPPLMDGSNKEARGIYSINAPVQRRGAQRENSPVECLIIAFLGLA